MPNKKKPAPKKPSRPSGKASKPAKKAPAKKPAPRKAAPKKAVIKKSVPKKTAKPVAKKPSPVKINKPAAASKPVVKKAGVHDARSLVSVKPLIKQIVKKEPPKPLKVVIPKTTTKSVKKYEPEFTKSVLDQTMQDPSLPSQRYSDADLAEFRELIHRKLEAAKKELGYLQGLITRKDESGDMDEGRYMTMEDGSVSMEREQLSQMASRQITFIDHLEKAMMRIENKTYGICRVTGRLIDKARLRAVPHATLSIEAKQMMNK
jgi:RNA polymerase-binding transcription factor DksA